MNKFADNPIMTPADTTLIVDAVAAKPFLDFYDLIVRKVVYGHVLSIFWLPLTAKLTGIRFGEFPVERRVPVSRFAAACIIISLLIILVW